MNAKIIANIGATLNFADIIKVVDIGALMNGAATPYSTMLKTGYANVIGFEPNPVGLAQLNRHKGKHETYLPYVVGDGKRHTLNYFNDPGMNSLLKPNPAVLDLYHMFANCSVVTSTEEVETMRLDDIKEASPFDFLKIDIQGAELMVFENATEQLKNAVVIHTEVEFHPLYIDQPLFSDVDRFLRTQGFVLHSFDSPMTNSVKPLFLHKNPFAGFGHLLYSDAVFIKDIFNLEPLSQSQLLKLAIILHDCYQSYDLVLRLLIEHDNREKTIYGKLYLNAITGASL